MSMARMRIIGITLDKDYRLYSYENHQTHYNYLCKISNRSCGDTGIAMGTRQVVVRRQLTI